MGRFDELTATATRVDGNSNWLGEDERLDMLVNRTKFWVQAVKEGINKRFDNKPIWVLEILFEDDSAEDHKLISFAREQSAARDSQMGILRDLVAESGLYGPMMLDKPTNAQTGRRFWALKDWEEETQQTKKVAAVAQKAAEVNGRSAEPNTDAVMTATPEPKRRGRPPKAREEVDTNPVRLAERQATVRQLDTSRAVPTASEEEITAKELVWNKPEPVEKTLKPGQWSAGVCQVCGNSVEGAAFLGEGDKFFIAHSCVDRGNRFTPVEVGQE